MARAPPARDERSKGGKRGGPGGRALGAQARDIMCAYPGTQNRTSPRVHSMRGAMRAARMSHAYASIMDVWTYAPMMWSGLRRKCTPDFSMTLARAYGWKQSSPSRSCAGKGARAMRGEERRVRRPSRERCADWRMRARAGSRVSPSLSSIALNGIAIAVPPLNSPSGMGLTTRSGK